MISNKLKKKDRFWCSKEEIEYCWKGRLRRTKASKVK